MGLLDWLTQPSASQSGLLAGPTFPTKADYLTNLGLGLLAAGGPSREPVGLGSAVGHAGLAANQMQQGNTMMALQQRLLGLHGASAGIGLQGTLEQQNLRRQLMGLPPIDINGQPVSTPTPSAAVTAALSQPGARPGPTPQAAAALPGAPALAGTAGASVGRAGMSGMTRTQAQQLATTYMLAGMPELAKQYSEYALGGTQGGFEQTPSGNLQPIGGGPKDPNYLANIAATEGMAKPYNLGPGEIRMPGTLPASAVSGGGAAKPIAQSPYPPSSLVNVQMGGEPAYTTEMGKSMATMHADRIKAGDTAVGQLNAIQAVKGLMSDWIANGGKQGAFEPMKARVGAVIQGAGFSPETLGLPKDAGPAQAMDALTNKLALGNIGAGGLPANNFSEADRNFIVDMQPRLKDTESGWAAKVYVSEKLAQRTAYAADFVAERQASGVPGSQIEKEWRQYVRENPLFGKDDRQAIQNLTNQVKQNSVIMNARDAIARGAKPDAVAKRLRDMGIDPGLLNQ